MTIRNSTGALRRSRKMPPEDTLGWRLKNARIERGINIDFLASYIGTDPSRITAIENRGEYPTLRTAIALAKVLDISIDYLVGLEDINGKRTAEADDISIPRRLSDAAVSNP